MKRTVMLFLAYILLAGCSQTVSQSAGNGSAAPAFVLTDINGNTYDSANTKGKVVILDFWATWCPPCRQEVPHFQELYRDYKPQGLEVIGIALDRGGAEDIKPFVQKNGVSYPVLMGNRSVVDAYGGVRSIPTTFVINRQGKIVEKYVGYRSKEVFENIVRELL